MEPITRRQFVASTIVGVTAAAATSSLSAADPAPVAPQIDCHTHFYDRQRKAGVDIPGKDLPADLKAVAVPLGVTGTIAVEASPLVELNQWLLDLAKADPFVVGVVGNLSAGTDGFRKHLDRFAKDKKFRGIRVNHDVVTAGLTDKSFLDDIKRLNDHDLALDVNGGPAMPSDVARLADKLPGLRIVINHAANLEIDGKAPPAEWASNLKAAAEYPLVFCKVSALVDQGGWEGGKAPTEMPFYKPVLDKIWEIFGEDRLIYGSNWPVSEQYAPYKVVHGIMIDYLKTRGTAAHDKYFAANSVAAYRWKAEQD